MSSVSECWVVRSVSTVLLNAVALKKKTSWSFIVSLYHKNECKGSKDISVQTETKQGFADVSGLKGLQRAFTVNHIWIKNDNTIIECGGRTSNFIENRLLLCTSERGGPGIPGPGRRRALKRGSRTCLFTIWDSSSHKQTRLCLEICPDPRHNKSF